MSTRTDLPYLRRRTLRSAGTTDAAPSAVPAPAPAVTSSLDLSGPAPVIAPPPPPKKAVVKARRLAPGGSEVLSPKNPTVRLTRVQSGIGALTVEAACSDAVGDLHLGAAYQLADGTSSVMQPGVPMRPNRPLLQVKRERFETLTVDLAQVRQLDRLVVYAYSPSGRPLQWGGTLVVRTYGGARVEMPLDGPPGTGVLVVLSVYNVDGELVLRNEPWELVPTIREAALAMGFDRITWLDPNTPVT